MIGMSARAVIAHGSCTSHTITVNVAASYDIAPAVQTVARSFNSQHKSVAGHCVTIEITEGQPSAVAAQIDGQDTLKGMAPVDAWIPDSSLWVGIAQRYVKGAQVVQPIGISVAKSPIMLVTSQAVASETGVFNSPASWKLLLPAAYGGPPPGLGLSVDLPDPSDSAVGLSTLVEIERSLGASATGRAGFTKFALISESTSDFDSVSALTSLVGSTGAPFYRRAIAEASEQAVIAYDRANPHQPLAARYPVSSDKALDSTELDYPYVLTTSDSKIAQAATAFGRYLLGSYAQSVIRYAGFRSSNGRVDQMPASSGLSSQPLAIASKVSASEAATTLASWQRLGMGSKVLVLIDDSAAMGAPVGVGNQTIEQVLTETAAKGLSMFPFSTQLGVWEIPDSQNAGNAYRSLVPIGPLTAAYGVMTRRDQLQEIIATLRPSSHPMRLYQGIVDGYKAATAAYSPNYSNALVVLTAGVDSSQDIALSSALAQLRSLYNPTRKVEIVVLVFGEADIAQLQELAAVTGGTAFPITNASEIGKIFVEAIASRMCETGCTEP